MRSIVTGGSGFIGSHVVDKLIEAGHEVIVLDYGVKPHRDDLVFVNVDIADYSSVSEVTNGVDYIFHLAAVSNVNHVFEKPVPPGAARVYFLDISKSMHLNPSGK